MKKDIRIEQKILSENERLAAELRNKMVLNGVLSLNIVSSPGAGKTALLEKTIRDLKDEFKIAIVAGDVQTENDAKRLVKAGGEWVKPLVTGGSCHLDARMIAKATKDLNLKEIDLLIIENVGNLVCPSSFDLGEYMKVVLISVPEGDDKPLKYPGMFKRSGLMILNKIDLLGTSDFSSEEVRKNARNINPDIEIIETSCSLEKGLGEWYDWLRKQVKRAKKRSK